MKFFQNLFNKTNIPLDTNHEINLPESFKMVDNGAGKGWHKGFEYQAKPHKFTVIDNIKGIELSVYYDSNYKPIRLTRQMPNSPIEEHPLDKGLAFFFLESTIKTDPRYIIRNYKKEYLKDIGFDGWGYITDTTKNPFNPRINVYTIIKFISPTQFKSFMFGNGKILDTQNWTYTIETIQ